MGLQPINSLSSVSKDNQKRLREEIEWCLDGFDGQLSEGASIFEETDAGHGRIEVRRYTQLPLAEQWGTAPTGSMRAV